MRLVDRSSLFVLLSCTSLTLLMGQASKTPGSGGGTKPPPTTTPPPSISIDRQQRPTLQNGSDNLAIHGGFIAGTVQMDDGNPPPQSLTIEKICGARRTAVAYTDRKGHFSFQVGGGASNIMPDASESSSNSGFGPPSLPGARASGQMQSDSSLSDCELTALLPGFRSDTVYLGQRRALDNPDVGVLILHHLSNVPGTTISATLLNAPKDARKAYDKGIEELRSGKQDNAVKNFRKAVELHPTFAAAWYELGHSQVMTDPAQARASFDKAILADSKYVSPYLDLSLMAVREQRWTDALEVTKKAIQLDPVDFPAVFFYKSIAEYNTNNLDAAEKSAREADHLDAAHRMPKIQQLLATVLMQKQDYVGAAQYMREYLKRAPDARDATQSRLQLAEMEKASLAKQE